MTRLQRAVVRTLGRAHAAVFRATRGRIGGRIVGAPVLLLTTTGRKTGAARTTPLLYLRDGDRLAVVASFGGAATHPAWYLNLRADDAVQIDCGSDRFAARACVATPDERERLWPRVLDMYAGYADYQRKTSRVIPIVMIERSEPIRPPDGGTKDRGPPFGGTND